MKQSVNTSVLVIDDEELVRDNIEDILTPRRAVAEDAEISLAASILFDTQPEILTPRSSNIPQFTVAKAANGMAGTQMVKDAVENGSPYAVIFLDMRMPGWDGLETVIQIRKYDSKAEIIFITAYSDHSIEDIVERAGQNVGYHCKPYAAEEIISLATKAVTDYDRLRNLEKLIESISSIGLNKYQLNSLLKNILDQLAISVGTNMALLGKLNEDYSYEKILSIGAIEERINLDELITRVKAIHIETDEVVQMDDLILAKMDCYSVFAVLQKHEKLKTEKLYLLKLFVQNAAQAIRNAELVEQLIQKEKLSVVGKAIGMVMHDLRSPIKNMQMITKMMREEGNTSEWTDMLDRCAYQASEIFDYFLDFLKETTFESRLLNLKYIVSEGVDLAAGTSDHKDININQAIPDTLMVNGDERKLKRVVMNLVNNAIDALKNKNVSMPEVGISAQLNTAGDQIVLTIRDNGPGIPQDILKSLFEPFVTRNKSEGTGLGLAIVKQNITAHNGSIEVENNNGAVFKISLPISA